MKTMRKKTLMLTLAVLAPLTLGLCIWTFIACMEFLQSPSGGGGATIGPGGQLVIGPPPASPTKALVAAAVTLPVCAIWIAFFILWMRAKGRCAIRPAQARAPCPCGVSFVLLSSALVLDCLKSECPAD